VEKAVSTMTGAWTARWQSSSRRGRVFFAFGLLVGVLCVVAALSYMISRDGISVVDAANPALSYLGVFALVALDGVLPIFPGETTLNTASTAAAQGTLDLLPVIVMGALGAIVGDSALFWIARRSAHKVERQLEQVKANEKVNQALALMDASAPILIVGGRYVPGLRFVVNATMGLSTMKYSRFLAWSTLSGIVWSVYTCVLAYTIGLSLGGYPLASVVISSLVTTTAIAVVFLTLRRHRAKTPAGSH
jgi:membrane-associated protein